MAKSARYRRRRSGQMLTVSCLGLPGLAPNTTATTGRTNAPWENERVANLNVEAWREARRLCWQSRRRSNILVFAKEPSAAAVAVAMAASTAVVAALATATRAKAAVPFVFGASVGLGAFPAGGCQVWHRGRGR